jgi:predicted nucleic acid-binding protein
LIQGFIREANTARVQTLLKSLFDKEPAVIHVPEFCLLECTNVLWKQMRFHGVSQATTQKALNSLMVTPVTIQPVIDLLPRALIIGNEHNLAIYDSIYIAMSEKLEHSLITVDIRQASVAATVGITLKSLSDFPKFEP